MKNLIILLILFSGYPLFAQNNTTEESKPYNYNFGNIYFGSIREKYFVVDEMEDYEYMDAGKNYTLEKLSKKYENVNYDYPDFKYEFKNYSSEFSNLTSFRPGDLYYISSINKVYTAKLTGYAIDGAGISKFYNLFESSDNSLPGTADFNNYFSGIICSDNKNITPINSKQENVSSINNFCYKLRKQIRFVKTEGFNDKFSESSEQIGIIKIRIPGYSGNAYAVSYNYALGNVFANGVYIMDGNADIIKVFRKFTAPTINREGYYEGEGNYETYFVEGAIDVNNDGYDELIISKSYYEGGGDEIYS